MTYRFGDFPKFGTVNIEAITKSSSSLAKTWQMIAAETTDYAKKSFDNVLRAEGDWFGGQSISVREHVLAA